MKDLNEKLTPTKKGRKQTLFLIKVKEIYCSKCQNIHCEKYNTKLFHFSTLTVGNSFST